MHIFSDIKKSLWHHLGKSIENMYAKFQRCSIIHTCGIVPGVSATSSKKPKLRNDAGKVRMASERNKENANVLLYLMHFAVYASTKWGSKVIITGDPKKIEPKKNALKLSKINKIYCPFVYMLCNSVLYFGKNFRWKQ